MFNSVKNFIAKISDRISKLYFTVELYGNILVEDQDEYLNLGMKKESKISCMYTYYHCEKSQDSKLTIAP